MCRDRAGCEFLLSMGKSKKHAPEAAVARIADTARRWQPMLRVNDAAMTTGPKGKGQSSTTLGTASDGLEGPPATVCKSRSDFGLLASK
jgi:hypothetical protein